MHRARIVLYAADGLARPMAARLDNTGIVGRWKHGTLTSVRRVEGQAARESPAPSSPGAGRRGQGDRPFRR